jgi:hypothetical protein
MWHKKKYISDVHIIQRALNIADIFTAQMCIKHGGLGAVVPQYFLKILNVNAIISQMRSIAVPQCM